ncbi:MAG: formyltransferase family protein [Cetobacterium sp.]|uniref:formyltransferase family protein n=1 Tax=Cetobacterium sp. TaxID=2071632 RepID=UPI003F41009F
MKVCIAGKNNIAINIVEELLRKFELKDIFIITNQNDLKKDTWQRSFYKYSKEKKLKIIDLTEAYEIEDLIFLSLEFDKIIKIEKFKETAKLYNIHFSKLPKYKGMYTSAHPILNNEKETGVTLHRIDNGIDTGEIIDQLTIDIDPEETARSLYFKYIQNGVKLVLKNLDNLISNNIKSYPQLIGESTYYSKKSLDYKNLEIDLNQTAQNIKNQIRAFNFREFQIPKIKDSKIISSRIINIRSTKKTGTILFEDNSQIMISTIDYNIVLYKDREEELFKACEVGDLKIVKDICTVKDHINIQNEKGWTPLIVATYNGHIEIVEFLIGIGANIELANFNGTNLLMYAKDFYKKSKNKYLFNLFLDLGITKDKKDYFGKSLNDYLKEEIIDL